MAAFLQGDLVRVRRPGWMGTWRILRLWKTNTAEGLMADLVRVDEPEPGERYPWTRGSALASELDRAG